MITFAGVLFLYGTEYLIYRTVNTREFVFPLLTAGVGLTWMWAQRDYYMQ
jgi:hypothetical protein